MHVLMLGWEFPPFITGGLGTACYGLTRALDRRGVDVTFVLPNAVDAKSAQHVRLLSPSPGHPHKARITARSSDDSGRDEDEAAQPSEYEIAQFGRPGDPEGQAASGDAPFRRVKFLAVPAHFVSPYQREPGERPVGAEGAADSVRSSGRAGTAGFAAGQPGQSQTVAGGQASDGGEQAAAFTGVPQGDYDGDMFQVVEQYARFCLLAAAGLHFDVIHAHDWMTYPAGLWLARATGKPLIVHVHSTEFDRSGEHVNQRIYDIERRGMHGAMRVIAVSQLTKNVLINRYGMRDDLVEVVYNGVEIEPPQGEHRIGIQRTDKIVLYFGRITYQKGPEYFIRAAKRVLEVMDNVKFVVAGSGDQARRMIEMAAELGIGHKVLFTGFLRGRDIQRVFAMADLYVMPSVSEPFGIAPLEAMANDVPALISKSSGVSEVLTHALKVDFWDVDDMANKIVAVLRYPLLSRTLREHGAFEVRRLTWDGAAERCERVYRAAMRDMVAPMEAKPAV